VVRSAWLQPCLRHRRTGYLMALRSRRSMPSRNGMRYLAGNCVGDLFHHLSAHTGSPEGAAYLRVELVLHGLHPGRGDSPTSSPTSPSPVSIGHAKSYSAFSGVQDAMTQWWYGHNASRSS